MKTTEKANIGGYSFTLEKDAYEALEKYLSEIGMTYEADPAAKEIVSDIEVRIAELLSEKCGKDKVVSINDVQEVCRRIGMPEDLKLEETESGAEKIKEMPKRLFRDIDHRVLGGVCSGIAARLNIDPVLIRLGFALLFCLAFFATGPMFGITVLVYIILWIIIPPAKTVEEKCRMRGMPIELEQFKGSVRNFGEEMTSSPALHAFGKIMVTVTGIIMICIGLSGLLGTAVLAAVPEITEEIGFTAEGTITPDIYGVENFIDSFMTNIVAWWMLAAIAGLFSVWMLYNGVLLTFSLKSPDWKPGLILFILWLVSILAFAGYLLHNLMVSISLTV